MRQKMAHQNDLRLIEDFRDKTVRIPLDVENNESAYEIGRRHLLPNIDQIPPDRLFGSAVPNVQRFRKFTVPVTCFEEFLAADDMH
jgi:hypothetical protein